MSELSFKTYCIENYAEYKNSTTSSVFENFLRTKLLCHLKTDYIDLHGMEKEYLMDYSDQWFSSNKYTFKPLPTNDTHHLVKTVLIPQVAELPMKNKGLSEAN